MNIAKFKKALIVWLFRMLGILIEVRKPLKRLPRFAFVGEFGYGILGFFPYLNHLASDKELEIRTLGLPGSTPFFSYSTQHTIVEGVSTDSWGTIKGALQLAKYANLRDPVFVPVNISTRSFRPAKGLPEWQSTQLKILHPGYTAYRKLDFKVNESEELNGLLRLLGEYVVINVKNYNTWPGTYVPNWYTENNLEFIHVWCKERGLKVVLNRSPVPASPDEPLVSDEHVDRFAKYLDVTDLSDTYQFLTLEDATLLQIEILRNARHVWAVQGGNALLAMAVSNSVSILMRGGGDWSDYKFFAKTYDCENYEFIYEPEQSLLAIANKG